MTYKISIIIPFSLFHLIICFLLSKQVKAADFAMASMVSLTVSGQSPNKMLLAIGKGSGSVEVWTCDILLRRFEKAGSCDAHNHAVSSY